MNEPDNFPVWIIKKLCETGWKGFTFDEITEAVNKAWDHSEYLKSLNENRTLDPSWTDHRNTN